MSSATLRSHHRANPQYRFISAALSIAACLVLSASSSSHAESHGEFYDPVERNIEGWTVSLDPKLLNDENKEIGERCLKALANHLQRITYIVPKDRLAELRKLGIWVDWQHSLGNMQYHPSRGWLLANDHDPRLVKHVHIPRAKALLDPRQWAKHPYVVLHELAHSYHDQVLGFDEPTIKSAFEKMKESGSYDEVLLFTGKRVKHYGLSNHKEYFAESTEAYFGVNDFYPFVRAELKEHDKGMYEVMETVWGKIK